MFLRTRRNINKLANIENICPEKLSAKVEKRKKETKENKAKLLKFVLINPILQLIA